MPRVLQTFLPVAGDPLALAAAFEGDPEIWLKEPRRDGATERWLVTLYAGALHHTVRLRVGDPWRSGPVRWRSLSWDPVGAGGDTTPTNRLLPSFDGELGLHAGGRGQVTLVLDGRYQPPGGRFGVAVDTIALHRLARSTATSLVADTATKLSARAEVVEASWSNSPD